MLPVTTSLRLYYFCAFAAIGVLLPYYPAWLQARGFEGFRMGLIVALGPAMGVLGPPTFGMLADALGLRGFLLRSACSGALLAMVALTLAIALGDLGGSFAVVFGASLLFSLFRSPMMMMADVIALERASNYGRVRLWGSLGFLVMALGAGVFFEPSNAVQLPLLVAIVLAIATWAAFRLPRQTQLPAVPVLSEAKRLLTSGAYLLFLLSSLTYQMSHVSYDLCITLRFRDLGASGSVIGLSWAIGTGAEILLMAMAAPWLVRWGAPRLLATAYFVGAVRWLLLATIESVPVLLLLQPLHAASFGLMWISATAYVKQMAGLGALGTAQGLFTGSIAVGAVIGMLVWSSFYSARGSGFVFMAAACLAFAAFIVMVVGQRRFRRSASGVSIRCASGG